MTSEFRSHFLLKLLGRVDKSALKRDALLCITNNVRDDIYIIAKVKTATSAKGRRFNFSSILINNYSSSPQSKPVGASMQGTRL